jgi:hypothetical protein
MKATQNTPALIIYLVDMSSSMSAEIGGQRKIDLVTDSLRRVAHEMVLRSTKGTQLSPRYRLAIYAYNDSIRDLLDGPRPITEVVKMGLPAMKPSGRTDTAAAFEQAERLLISQRGNLHYCPAPLVCHLTDGEYTADDPLPIVERIQQMTFPDGAVLVENIFLDADALISPVTDPSSWTGVSSPDELATKTAKHLFHMSSPAPESYLELFADRGYALRPSARLLLPGDTPEMIAAAFTMSGMTPMA